MKEQLEKVRKFERSAMDRMTDPERRKYITERLKDAERWKSEQMDRLKSENERLTEQLQQIRENMEAEVEQRVRELMEPWQERTAKAERDLKKRTDKCSEEEKRLHELAVSLEEKRGQLEEDDKRLEEWEMLLDQRENGSLDDSAE